MTGDEATAAMRLQRASFSTALNMNDVFAFAAAESVEFDTADFRQMVPVIVKYNYAAFIAYAAIKKGIEPNHCKCHKKIEEDYEAAKAEILALKASDPDFMAP